MTHTPTIIRRGDVTCTLYCGDCRDILPMLGYDLIVADPPYGVGFHYKQHSDERKGYDILLGSWIAAIPLKRAAVTPGINNVCLWPQPRWILAWMKTNCMGANRLSGPSAVSRNLWEPVLWYGSYPPNPPSRDLLHAPITPEDNGNGHPCPKPLALLLKIVLMGSNQTETVCDPFMGSGTTGVACLKTGRNFIGIEIDPGYFAIACERIQREANQAVLAL